MTDDFYIPPVVNDPAPDAPEKKPRGWFWYFCAIMATIQWVWVASSTHAFAREIESPGHLLGMTIGVVCVWYFIYWVFNR